MCLFSSHLPVAFIMRKMYSYGHAEKNQVKRQIIDFILYLKVERNYALNTQRAYERDLMRLIDFFTNSTSFPLVWASVWHAAFVYHAIASQEYVVAQYSSSYVFYSRVANLFS